MPNNADPNKYIIYIPLFLDLYQAEKVEARLAEHIYIPLFLDLY